MRDPDENLLESILVFKRLLFFTGRGVKSG